MWVSIMNQLYDRAPAGLQFIVPSSMHLPVKSRLENAPKGNSQKITFRHDVRMLSTSVSRNQGNPSVASWTPGMQPSWFHAGLLLPV
ncbi:uncharacterized protein IAS62_005426 [Cryptococcus decagattii]|uniref:Uncharacterized protein n=1 Tax=Cryptococcus decagattii TaxID=1859122 RepID=A0ABZ2B0X8_9TREE